MHHIFSVRSSCFVCNFHFCRSSYHLLPLRQLLPHELIPRSGLLTTDRNGVRLVVLGNKILAMGGGDRGYGDKTVDIFNMTTRTWSSTEEMMEKRSFHGVTGVPSTAVGIPPN